MNTKLIILTNSQTSDKIAINPRWITTIVTDEDGTSYIRIRDDYNYRVKESIDQIVELVNS